MWFLVRTPSSGRSRRQSAPPEWGGRTPSSGSSRRPSASPEWGTHPTQRRFCTNHSPPNLKKTSMSGHLIGSVAKWFCCCSWQPPQASLLGRTACGAFRSSTGPSGPGAPSPSPQPQPPAPAPSPKCVTLNTLVRCSPLERTRFPALDGLLRSPKASRERPSTVPKLKNGTKMVIFRTQSVPRSIRTFKKRVSPSRFAIAHDRFVYAVCYLCPRNHFATLPTYVAPTSAIVQTVVSQGPPVGATTHHPQD